MSRVISARHRATVNHSIALEGLSFSAKTGAVALGKPAIIAAATGGIVLAVGVPAQAGTYTQEAAGTAIQAPAAAAAGVHTVVAGDTLGGIAALYDVNLNTLLAQNGLSYASVLYPGQQITLTGASAALTWAPAAVSPAAAPTTEVSYIIPAAPAPAAAVAPVAAQSGYSLTSSAIAPIQQSGPVSDAAAGGVGAALVASAYSQLGSIQDCTILVEQALRSIGKDVGDLGPTQFYQYGTVVSTPAPGDLVIRPGHIGIYVGNGEVISSGMNGANLTIKHPLSDLAGSSFVRVNG